MHLPESLPAPPCVNDERYRVMVVEDHPMVRQGMRALLGATDDFVICGEVETAGEVLASIARLRPDVICLDLVLGASDGFELIRTIRGANPKARILVLSVRDEEMYAERCLASGALGYAMKTDSNEMLLTALRRVARGDVYLSSHAAMRVIGRVREPGVRSRTGLPGLTDRELQVFQLVGAGLSTREIAERLGIGIKTIESHRENIKNRLGITTNNQLVREAVRWAQQL